jgi:TPR repeat protein
MNLGLLRENNGETSADALRTWREAADKGVPEACDRLGRAYRDGELGLTADDVEARKWFQKAADLGDAGGALNLGAMLMLGRGGSVDQAAALALYRRAADQGSATAEANIAGVYWLGTADVPKDRAEAVRHYQIAAKGGNVVAERMLSVAYGTGDGIERDEVQQLDWARKAADHGDAVSQNTVGYLILTGVGGTYDYVEAAMWLTLAAERSGNSGELHDLSTENLRTALGQLNPQEQEEVTKRVAHWHEVNGGA